jgi:hypothetical protein
VALALPAAGAGYFYMVLTAAFENSCPGTTINPSPRRFKFDYVLFHQNASVPVRDYIMCGGEFYAVCPASILILVEVKDKQLHLLLSRG